MKEDNQGQDIQIAKMTTGNNNTLIACEGIPHLQTYLDNIDKLMLFNQELLTSSEGQKKVLNEYHNTFHQYYSNIGDNEYALFNPEIFKCVIQIIDDILVNHFYDLLCCARTGNDHNKKMFDSTSISITLNIIDNCIKCIEIYKYKNGDNEKCEESLYKLNILQHHIDVIKKYKLDCISNKSDIKKYYEELITDIQVCVEGFPGVNEGRKARIVWWISSLKNISYQQWSNFSDSYNREHASQEERNLYGLLELQFGIVEYIELTGCNVQSETDLNKEKQNPQDSEQSETDLNKEKQNPRVSEQSETDLNKVQQNPQGSEQSSGTNINKSMQNPQDKDIVTSNNQEDDNPIESDFESDSEGDSEGDSESTRPMSHCSEQSETDLDESMQNPQDSEQSETDLNKEKQNPQDSEQSETDLNKSMQNPQGKDIVTSNNQEDDSEDGNGQEYKGLRKQLPSWKVILTLGISSYIISNAPYKFWAVFKGINNNNNSIMQQHQVQKHQAYCNKKSFINYDKDTGFEQDDTITYDKDNITEFSTDLSIIQDLEV